MPGACCILGVCCPPNQQATGVAEKYGIPQDAALALVTDHQLVPRHLEALAGAPHLSSRISHTDLGPLPRAHGSWRRPGKTCCSRTGP